jgi:hypothetical protein
MKKLNVEATAVFNEMIGMLEDFCVRIDNSNGKYMPVYVALYDKSLGKRIISIGHYKSIEGEIIADPEMRFFYNEVDNSFYPIYYRQDCLGIKQDSVKLVHDKIISVNKMMQEEHTRFANTWIKNIKEQQHL